MIKNRSLQRVYVVSACRTPIGETAGSLSSINDVDMAALAINEAVRRAGIETRQADGVYVGCCFPAESYNLARKAILKAGMDSSVPGATINRTCCSSIEALVQGARQIMTGDADVIIVGGVENMSHSHHVMANAIKSMRTRAKGELPALHEIGGGSLLDEVGLGVELIANKYGITREMQDEHAYLSHRKALQAKQKGCFDEEIFPVKMEKDDLSVYLDNDENILEGITLEDFAKEKPFFLRDGTITKLNATSINDGAAAMVIMSEKMVVKCGIKPLVEYICSETVGVPCENVSIAPVDAIRKLTANMGITLDDIDLIECNEAYAAQYVACKKLLEWNDEKVNINGGSIALGHPLGCTGLRICTTLIYSLRRMKLSIGMVAMCAGGGMGQSILFQTV